MSSWPVNWIGKALAALNVPVNKDTMAIMRAWKDSTPLPPYSNNPLGMPAGSSGAVAYLSTDYALFPSMARFYVALQALARSQAGKQLTLAMHGDAPYPATWRAISALKWPGSKTETDYPAALLDLTTASYQASVNATPAASRKTSGIVIAPNDDKLQVIQNAHAVVQAAQAFTNAHDAIAHLHRNGR